MNYDHQLRPRDLASLLLAADDVPPRQRARDQQADRAGLQLRHHVLSELIARNPDPHRLEQALLEIVQQIGPPTGPTRAIAAGVRDEWEIARSDPGLLEHALGEAVHAQLRQTRGRGS